MSLNNGMLIRRIAFEAIHGKELVYYDVLYIPCMDNPTQTMLKIFTELESAIKYALTYEFEYGIIFEGFT